MEESSWEGQNFWDSEVVAPEEGEEEETSRLL